MAQFPPAGGQGVVTVWQHNAWCAASLPPFQQPERLAATRASASTADGPAPRPPPAPAFAEVVRRYLREGEQAEQVVAEISAINAELLARREPS